MQKITIDVKRETFDVAAVEGSANSIQIKFVNSPSEWGDDELGVYALFSKGKKSEIYLVDKASMTVDVPNFAVAENSGFKVTAFAMNSDATAPYRYPMSPVWVQVKEGYECEAISGPSKDNMDAFCTLLQALQCQAETYVTPQMFGAVGDGVTDDTESFKKAIEAGTKIFVPAGTYLITDNLTINDYQIFEGTNNTQISFNGAFGLILNGRHITVRDMNLYNKTVDGIGILLTGDDTSHYVKIDNVQIINFLKGLTNSALMWNNTFSNVRCTLCTNAFVIALIGNIPNFGLTFTNCYSNSCDLALNVNSTNASFIGCNFGIRKSVTFGIGNSNLQFINCNFECDSQIESGTIMNISGRALLFNGCTFIMNGGSSTTFMSLYVGVKTVGFINCEYKTTNNNLAAASNFFNVAQFNADVCGVKFISGNSNMPRPNPYSNQCMNWIDMERNTSVKFYETINKTNLYAGMTLYEYKNNVLCYYDGTNVISLKDGTIIC